jgi:hypothetical protein
MTELIYCFEDGGALISCHNLETKSTSALLWSIRDSKFIDKIISNIMTETRDRRHPFHLLHHILLEIVSLIRSQAGEHLKTLSSVARDLNLALEDRVAAGFEFYFLRASQKYFRTKTVKKITPDFSEAEALCDVIIDNSFPLLNGMPDVEAGTQLWMPHPKAKVLLLRKRLEALKTDINLNEENLAKKFSIVSVNFECLSVQ